MLGKAKKIGFFFIILPDAVLDMWRFEPVFLCAFAHVYNLLLFFV